MPVATRLRLHPKPLPPAAQDPPKSPAKNITRSPPSARAARASPPTARPSASRATAQCRTARRSRRLPPPLFTVFLRSEQLDLSLVPSTPLHGCRCSARCRRTAASSFPSTGRPPFPSTRSICSMPPSPLPLYLLSVTTSRPETPTRSHDCCSLLPRTRCSHRTPQASSVELPAHQTGHLLLRHHRWPPPHLLPPPPSSLSPNSHRPPLFKPQATRSSPLSPSKPPKPHGHLLHHRPTTIADHPLLPLIPLLVRAPLYPLSPPSRLSPPSPFLCSMAASTSIFSATRALSLLLPLHCSGIPVWRMLRIHVGEEVREPKSLGTIATIRGTCDRDRPK